MVVCVLDFSTIHSITVVVVSDVISHIISDIILATLIRNLVTSFYILVDMFRRIRSKLADSPNY